MGRLLRGMGFSLRVNHKKLCNCSTETRDQQFQYITEMREEFARKGRPIVSVDTKKRELVGNFKNNGLSWQREPIPVNSYDFRSDADGIAIPYGIYDVRANQGSVFIGVSHDTPSLRRELAQQMVALRWPKALPQAHAYVGARRLWR